MIRFPTNGWATVIPEGDCPGTLHKVNMKRDGTLGVWYFFEGEPEPYMAINTFPDGRAPQVTTGRTMTEVRRKAEAARRAA